MKENKVRLSDIVKNGRPETEAEKGRQEKTRKTDSLRLSDLKFFGGNVQTKPSVEREKKESTKTDPSRLKDLLDNSDRIEKNPPELAPSNVMRDIPHSNNINKDQKHTGELKFAVDDYPGFRRVPEPDREKPQLPEERLVEAGAYPKADDDHLSLPDGKKISLVNFSGQDDHEEIYTNLKAILRQIKDNVKKGLEFSIESASDIIFSIIRTPNLLRNIYPLTIPVPQQGDYNVSHQVNTMIYALKIGMGSSFTEKRLHELAMSALLHDVGMFLIPESITNKNVKLTNEDLDAIKQHPIIGRKILDAFGANPWLAEVAYHHHERENGQGYPEGLEGNQISEYAKIVGIVDSYEAMTHNRPYRKALMQAFSAKELIKSKNMLFSPSVIRIFLKEISLYPLGSYVRLNNKSIGQVIGTDQTRPLRPDIRVLFDSEGNRIAEDTIIRLDQNPIFFIQDSVSEDEMPDLKYPGSEVRFRAENH